MNYFKSHSPSVSFMPPKTIVLVGLMGSGKTSVGKRLAKRLELDFFDSDHEVELAAGCSIRDIFNVYGEETFRKGEYRVINRLLSQPTHILATGGGSFVYEETREFILQSAISVWLKADLATLVARVSRRTDRPLLEDVEDPTDILKQLIEERYPLYGQANVHVDTFDESTNATVDRVIQKMGEFVCKNYPNYYVLKSI
jgi:shikimate kinase